jgi:hypothetical protein
MGWLLLPVGLLIAWRGYWLLRQPRVDVVSSAALEDIQRREDRRTALEEALGTPEPRKRERVVKEPSAPKAYAKPWGSR